MTTVKRFFISMLGSIAGFWISIMVAFFALLIVVGIAAASGAGGAKEVKDHSILHLALSGEIADRASTPDIMNMIMKREVVATSLSDIVAALNAAADDKHIDGVFIDCQGMSAGLAMEQAMIRGIEKVKKAGKWVIAYSDNYTQGDYYVACHADSVLLNPIGSIDIHGLGSSTPYFKGLLDKLGVEMQVFKVGTYKSAVEPFILTEMSAPAREQQELYLSMMWDAVKDDMAASRGLKPENIDSIANGLSFAETPEYYKSQKLIDGLRYRHEVEETLMALTEQDDRDDLRFITPEEYCAARDLPKVKNPEKTIAVLYAVGEISDAGDEGIIGDDMVNQIFDLTDDDDIDALILRVNSPGGSAFASEQIWEALEQFKKVSGKPYYVSMGDVAASGGYYISCGADSIYAEPLTITGSIGIFGMLPNANKLFTDHLGVNMSTVRTNPNATFPSIFEPISEQQRAGMQGYVNRGYELFTGRVAKGRKMSQDSVKVIAEGRVWDGATAKKIGLVDCLGGLDMAIADMAKRLGVEPDRCRITEYPDLDNKWWKELLSYGNKNIKEAMLKDEIGPDAMAVYKAIERVKGMSILQCRMETVIVK